MNPPADQPDRVGNLHHFGDTSGSGPTLKFGGSAITVGQFGAWTPIAVEQTASGYQVAWKAGNQFTIWTTDSNGNYISNTPTVAGTDPTLKSAENRFIRTSMAMASLDGT